jgi:fructokinase
LKNGKNFDLVSFGEIIYDIYGKKRILGGAPFNTSSFASFLGLKTALITAVNNKETEQIEKEIKLRNIEPFLQKNNYMTGKARIELDKNKIPTYSIEKDSAYDHIKNPKTLIKLVNNSNFFYFGSLSQRCEESQKTLIDLLSNTPSQAVYDINLRNGISSWQKIVKKSLRFPIILKMNNDESKKVKLITGYQNIKQIFEKTNIGYVFVTLGEKGACLYQKNKDPIFAEAPKCDVIDTTGCGDAFTAAVIFGFHNKWYEQKTLDFAVDFSSLVAQYEGAFDRDFLIEYWRS